MESSEDDAGTATIASRRATAREKDIEQAENTNATSSSLQQTSEARTSCQTPAMSEENFDGDSVPSPTAHDVNTSTEAILDMIDEIVDGPGAPKRLPLALDAVAECATNSDHPNEPELPTTDAENDSPQIPPASSATSAKSEQNPQACADETLTECVSHSDNVVLNTVCIESPQTSTSVVERIVVAESSLADDCPVVSEKSQVSSDCPPLNIPSSSVVETVHSISDVSECQTQDRTVKCVSSSDTRDNVIVESAESTSSESSTADGKVVVTETTTRSPLRRRLIRPTLSDRRPDSTVSSTVDVSTTEQSNSELVIKDVSSSSDAVPTVHGNVKPEEISNLSEISVCKAETSVSPPKKIKLIRQRITPFASCRDSIQEKEILLPDPGHCQSTSQDNSEPTLPEPCSESVSTAGTLSTPDVEMISDLNKDTVMNEASAEIPELNECTSQQKQCEEFKNSIDSPIMPNRVPMENIESTHEKDVSSMKLDSETDKLEALSAEVNTHAECTHSNINKCDDPTHELHESTKQIPKLTIKLSNKQSDEMKSPVPKLTIKPIKPPAEEILKDSGEQIPNVTKINIKPILKPSEVNEVPTRKLNERDSRKDSEDQIPLVTKINIKPILKPPEKINDVHRKSSSSEISESEYSENDESTSTSDQASASDQGSSNVIPKVTIKLGKPGTQSEGKFYTEKNIPKITIKGIQPSEKEDTEKNIPKLIIKGIQHSEKEELEKNIPKLKIKGIQHSEKDDQEAVSKLKLIKTQNEDKQLEKIPKLTIKTVSKSEGQPLSPKLTIKPLKPPEDCLADCSDTQHIPKLKITTESISSTAEVKENVHVPKITIKPVTRTDVDTKTAKKATIVCDSSEHIPVVTKLNIKPILKPTDGGETSEVLEDKVPVVSKLYIKPVVKPKDNEVDSSVEDIPKITKLNIKPIINPEGNSSEEKDCDELNADVDGSIPVVTKINIKPTVKPQVDDITKDLENQSSETGNSSDDNTDIPVVTKINIKPVIKPVEDVKQKMSNDDTIPTVTKLTIKSIVKPDENISPSSPKRDSSKSTESRTTIPVVTKLNIKPVIRPEDIDQHKSKGEDKVVKNPPLLMKINMKAVTDTSSHDSLTTYKKVNNIDDNSEHIFNNISEESSIALKSDIKVILKSSENDETKRISSENSELDRVSLKEDSIDLVSVKPTTDDSTHLDMSIKQNCVPERSEKRDCLQSPNEGQPGCSLGKTSDLHNMSASISLFLKPESIEVSSTPDKKETSQSSGKSDSDLTNAEAVDSNTTSSASDCSAISQLSKQQMSLKNCTLLKKLLENTDDELDKRRNEPSVTITSSPATSVACKDAINCEPVDSSSDIINCEPSHDNDAQKESQSPDMINDLSIIQEAVKVRPIQEICKEASENLKHPLEINVSEKIVNQGSGQDSPRIILKINKTDHGPSAKIITEDTNQSDTLQQDYLCDNTQEIVNDKQSPKKNLVNSRRKATPNVTNPVTLGKRLRSSRIVENTEKSPVVKRNVGKRPSTADGSPPHNKEPELSTLETKRLKLGQLLSNKSLTITPVVAKVSQTSPVNKTVDIKQGKTINHSLLNNENCSKNGNSKLHNILSNLQAKQMQAVPLNDINCSDKSQTGTSEIDSNISSGSGDTMEIVRVENCRPEVQEMMISENCEFRDFNVVSDDISQDPLEVDSSKTTSDGTNDSLIIPKMLESTPQPKKRGRPRKLPLSEGAKPAPVDLPVPALDERPQRSLRLYRDRPAIIAKPRGGRGRGRGGRRPAAEPEPAPAPAPAAAELPAPEPAAEGIDPTSSRIKLPRMTEALDKMPAACSTPLSSRRRSSVELSLFGEAPEAEGGASRTSPEPVARGRGRGGRGRGRGGRATLRTPRGRGRGRGGGRGAMYMKETLGIYGRVCGPATTTVQLFEEETCMMDDNATPAKPSHLLDEDSQSSVKSSTNESSKMKKSKFADLFDSNKVWTAADVKEYMWPQSDKSNEESQVMMIQEQVAMFLNVKSFKRRYPELKRRTIMGDERDHVLSKGLVTEALCDLGITAVDASEVLDIMLSDYPHKYEEYRSHQRERQLAAPEEPEVKPEVKPEKVEVKCEPKPAEIKPEPPKVDPEKLRQDMARAAIASASEWNARVNALRRPACADLQTMTVQRRRPAGPAPATAAAPAAPAPPPPEHVRPPAGFYPHALLPGQYQHTYRYYTPDQLRYFPLNTALAVPPAPPSGAASSSDSEGECSVSDDSSRASDVPSHQKRKRLTKTKRISQAEALNIKKEEKEDSRDGEVDLCHACNLRLEANRKYTHERFLVCANCNAKLHPGCVELSADTIRKCREYPWQCAECKSCCACRRPQDDDKMLFCDLCDRGFHIYCVGLDKVPSGRWHCVECAICKSCGARSPGGPAAGVATPSGGVGGAATPASPAPPAPPTPAGSVTLDTPGAAQWHHQTRRGPGGHKVYSHSLCTPCARAYRIGRYCPLCDRSFIGPKGTMQLVICKLCDRQLHQECVRATVATLNVLDYTCGECRRGGITSRAAAVRLAPRTVATLFMAKRRFNKYAHRQYLASRLRAKLAADDDASNEAEAEGSDPEAGDPLEGEGAGEPPPDAD